MQKIKKNDLKGKLFGISQIFLKCLTKGKFMGTKNSFHILAIVLFSFSFVQNFRLNKNAFLYVLNAIQEELSTPIRSTAVPVPRCWSASLIFWNMHNIHIIGDFLGFLNISKRCFGKVIVDTENTSRRNSIDRLFLIQQHNDLLLYRGERVMFWGSTTCPRKAHFVFA